MHIYIYIYTKWYATLNLSSWRCQDDMRIYIEDLDYNLVQIFDSEYKPTSNQFLVQQEFVPQGLEVGLIQEEQDVTGKNGYADSSLWSLGPTTKLSDSWLKRFPRIVQRLEQYEKMNNIEAYKKIAKIMKDTMKQARTSWSRICGGKKPKQKPGQSTFLCQFIIFCGQIHVALWSLFFHHCRNSWPGSPLATSNPGCQSGHNTPTNIPKQANKNRVSNLISSKFKPQKRWPKPLG